MTVSASSEFGQRVMRCAHELIVISHRIVEDFVSLDY